VFIMGRRQGALDKRRRRSARRSLRWKVRSPTSAISISCAVGDKRGGVDIVASTGFVERVIRRDATPAHFDKTFGINARGVYFTMQKALPLLRDGGAVVLVSSSLHLKGLLEHSAYAATKAVVRSVARTWAMELKDRGIRANTLLPGAIGTPIIASSRPETRQIAPEHFSLA
jgi:NAD(P)-dependent dehydrogenase (short-subunit alcohol dehydrogenase family)